MINRLKDYVERLFDNAPKTKKVFDLKDELTADLIEKYNDLLARGKEEEEAYNLVINGIGDISELISQLEGSNATGGMDDTRDRKRNATYIALAVMLYILSVVPVILSEVLGFDSELGVVFMFVFIAIATGLLVYRGASKPKYIKADETLVEEFKEWKSGKSKNDSLRNAISSAFWTSIVAIYLIISFWFGIWAYSWIIFIIGAAITQIIKAIFELRGE